MPEAFAQRAAFRLLLKFHKETACGRPYHWAECEALVDAFGFDSWQQWSEMVENDLDANVGNGAAAGPLLRPIR